MQLTDWGVLAAVCAAGALSPGPSLLFILATRARRGTGAAVAASIGHGLGVGVYALAAVAGVATLLTAWPTIARGLEVAGALYLLWLGWQFWPRSPCSPDSKTAESESPARHWAFVSGLAVALFNPKVLFFFAGVVAAVAPTSATVPEQFGMAAMATTIDALWYAVVSLSGAVLSGMFARSGVQKALALLLAGVGLALLFWG